MLYLNSFGRKVLNHDLRIEDSEYPEKHDRIERSVSWTFNELVF